MSARMEDTARAAIGKHRRLLTSPRDGKVLSALMLPLVRRATPNGYGVLTTLGRKTGKPRPKCVRIIRDGDRAYLVALRPPHITAANPGWVNAWVHNIRAQPEIRLQIADGTFDGTAREITDPSERERARSLLVDTICSFDYAECGLHLRGLPNRTKIVRLHRYWVETGIVVAIDLHPSPPVRKRPKRRHLESDRAQRRS